MKSFAARRLTINHFAALRASIDGLSPTDIRDRWLPYLGDARQTVGELRWMVEELTGVLRRLGRGHERRLLRIRLREKPSANAMSFEEFVERSGDLESWGENDKRQFYKDYLDGVSDAKANKRQIKTLAFVRLRRDLLVELESLIATERPQLSDDVATWLPQNLSNSLTASSVNTFAAVVNRMERLGSDWHRGIRSFGAIRARSVEAWLRQYDDALGIETSKLVANGVAAMREEARNAPIALAYGVVPIERLALPGSLTGEVGSNRSPKPSTSGAKNDLDAIRAFLMRYEKNGQLLTFRSYRTECERFLLWMTHKREKPLASATHIDLTDYFIWLKDPQPAWKWVGKRTERYAALWKPFAGKLKPGSIRHSRRVLSALFTFLQKDSYIDESPFHLVATSKGAMGSEADKQKSKAVTAVTTGDDGDTALGDAVDDATHTRSDYISRSLPMGLIDAVKDAFSNDRESVRDARDMVIVMLGAQAGMRRGEIANAKCGQIRERINKDGEVIHLLSTLGKGGTTRSIPLAPDMMDALGHYMVLRGHGATRAGWAEDLPLVAHVRNFTVGKRDDDPDKCHLTSQSVYDAFKRAVGRAVAAMPEETPAAAKELLLTATTHWLRHSFATDAVRRGVSLVALQKTLGHKDPKTTSLYTTTDEEELYQQVVSPRK